MRTNLPSGRPVEIARPSGGRPPTQGLVMFPDIGGLRPLFDDHVARIADEQAWAVAAVEPWPRREEMPLEERLESVGTIDDRDFLDDAVAAADLLEVDPVGVTGFCMGGMFTLKAAGTGRFHRAVAFYGMIRVPHRWQGPGQTIEPLNAVQAGTACPTLAIIGEADPWTPADDVAALEAAGAEVVRYADADHGFAHDPNRPAHRAADAADAWARAITFLSGRGG